MAHHFSDVHLKSFSLGVGPLLFWGLEIYKWVVIARALISWVNPDPYNPIVRFLYNVTEPVLDFLRRRLPLVVGGVDLSPLAVVGVIIFLQRFLVPTLVHYAGLIN